MKKINKILVGLFAFSMLFSVFGVTSVVAAEDPPVDVLGDTYTYRVHADNLTMFTFQNKTQLRFNSNVNIDLNMNCEASKIGLKTFELELDSDQDMQMNMTCTEEQAELGLLMGSTHQIRNRNRNRYHYEEGFCLEMKGNFSSPIQAKLKIKETNQNRDGTWAFYNGTIGEGEWVAVQTASQNGYLVAESDHFSFWTILLPEAAENTLWIYLTIAGVIIGVVAIIAVIYFKKRK